MRTYLFGPLDRQGLLLGLRLTQILVMLAAVLASLVVGYNVGYPFGVFAGIAVVGTVAIFVLLPFEGLTLEQWTPIALAFLAQRLKGEHRYRTEAPTKGTSGGGGKPPKATPPPCLKGLEFIEGEVDPSRPERMGVIKDRNRNSYIAVLGVRARAFYLLESSEQDRLLDGWGEVLAGLANTNSPIVRLQWIERTFPDAGNSIGAYLREAIRLDPSHRAVESYLDLAAAAGPVSLEHETFLVVELSAHRARRAIKKAGKQDRGACAVLARQLGFLASGLESIGVVGLEVVGVLPPRLLAKVFADTFDPETRSNRDRRALINPEDEGIDIHNPWPAAVETSWRHVRTDSTLSRTFWVREWPLRPVGADFMSSLILEPSTRRTISLVMQPVPPHQAERQSVGRQTEHSSNDELREKLGFVKSSRTRREQEQAERRDEQLSRGHADFRFSAYVTVSAADEEALDEAAGEIEMTAHGCHMNLLCMSGQQDVALTYTLPLCRGLS